MKFNKYTHEDGKIYYTIDEHRAEIFRFNVAVENLETKLKLVDEFLKTTHAKFKNFTRKEVLLAFAKFDDEVAEYYKKQYPKGGSRKNAGRKQGSLQKAPKSERTERFTMAITQREKLYLIKQLEQYRKRHAIIDNDGDLNKETESYIETYKKPRKKVQTLDEALKEYKQKTKKPNP